MNKIFLLTFFIIFIKLSYSQNLVPNPDFEERTFTTFDSLKYWTKCIKSDSPDYFSNDATTNIFEKYIGGINPYSGSSYVGIFVYRNNYRKNKEIREYIQIRLTEKLKKDTIYYAELLISPDIESNVACNSLGMYFSATKIKKERTSEMYKFIPQISNPENKFITNKNKWEKISGTFKAEGNEQYLIIGNFNSDQNTNTIPDINTQKFTKKQKWNLENDEVVAYYYLDKITVYTCDSLNEKSDIATNEIELTADTICFEPIVDIKINDTLNKISNLSLTNNDEKDTLTVNNNLHKDSLIYFNDKTNFNKGQTIICKNILFKNDKTDFTNTSIIELNTLLRLMRNNSTMEIEIRGHTDNVGNEIYNINLSVARAKAVKNFLVKNDIASDRIQCYGYGSALPIADNKTEKGRKQNRRVEFLIIKK